MSRVFAVSKSRVFALCTALVVSTFVTVVSAPSAVADPGPWTITGTVTSQGVGSPSTDGTEVFLLNASKSIVDSTTVASGNYSVVLPATDTGTITLVLAPSETDTASGYTVETLTVTGAEAATISKSVVLKKGALRGFVQDPAGNPVFDADVSCFDAISEQSSFIQGCGASTNSRGYFSIKALDATIPGPVGLLVRAGTFADWQSATPIETPTSTTQRIAPTVQLKNSNLRVQVTANGAPVPEWAANVELRWNNNNSKTSAATRANGISYFAAETGTAFTIYAMPTQMLPQSSSFGRGETTTVQLGNGPVRNLTIALPLNNMSVKAFYDTDTAIPNLFLEARPWNQSGGYFQSGLNAMANESGVGGFALTPNWWQIVGYPNDGGSPNLSPSGAIVQVAGSGAELTFSRCPLEKFFLPDSGAQPSCSETVTALAVVNGLPNLGLKVGRTNVQLQLRKSNSDAVSGVDVSISKGVAGTFQRLAINDRSSTNGSVRFSLTPGAYSVRLEPNQESNLSQQQIYLLIDTSTVVRCSAISSGSCSSPETGTVSGGVTNFNVIMGQEATNATLSVVSGAETVTGVGIYYQKRVGNNWAQGTFKSTGAGSTANVAFETGTYQVNVQPPTNSGKVATNFIINVSTNGSAISSITKCSNADFDWQQGSCFPGKSTAWTPSSGTTWNIELQGTNFVGVVCKPSGAAGCDTVTATNMSVEVQKKTPNDMGGGGFFFSWFGNSMVSTANGRFTLALTNGDYRVIARKPFNATGAAAGWTDTTANIRFEETGTVVKTCDTNFETCTTTAATLANPFQLKFATPNFVAEVRSGGSGVGWAWVEVLQPNPNQCEGCRSWLQGTNSDQTGQVSLQLAAGTYILGVNPPFGSASGAVRTEFTVVINQAGTVETVTGGTPAASQVDGKWQLTMAGANVTGFVKQGSPLTGVPYVDIQVEKKDGDFWQWQPTFARTDQTGYFAMSLGAGTYRLRAQPSGTAGASLSSKLGSEFTLASAASNHSETITLSSPNVPGSVTGDGNPIRWAWIQVDKWDDQFQNYQWSPNVPGTSTNNQGSFALTLPKGRWRLTVNPQPDSAYSKASREVWVNETGTAFSNAAETATITSLSIQLSAGNLTGSVTRGGSPATSGWVNVEKYNATLGFWEWADLWANVGSNGQFKMNLQSAGSYKLTVNPPFGDSTYSRKVVYVTATGTSTLTLCERANETAAKLVSCDGVAGANTTITVPVALESANVTGKVLAAGAAVRDAWISVQQYDSTMGFWKWLGGTNTNNTGSFAIKLDQGSYRLEVNPPWNNSTGLTRQFVSITVGSGSTVVPNIVLSSGNLTGKVTELTDAGTGVGYTGVMVEKWTVAPWDSSQYTWQWADMPMNTKADGTFGGNIADTTGTIYKFTSFPGGYNPRNLSRASVIAKTVVTNGTLQWCELTSNTKLNNSASANPFGDCTPSSNASMKLVLKGASVTGTIYANNGSTALRDVWIGVARTKTATGTDIWQWEGGSSSSVTGGFALNIDFTETGTYRVEFNPPWGSSSLSRFTATINVSGCNGTTCTTVTTSNKMSETYTAGSKSLVWNLQFPGSNLTGKICDPDNQSSCTAISKAWVNVFEETGTSSTWSDLGSGTDQTGTFRLSLTAGKVYRLEANPSWENPKGVRTNTFVMICSDGTYKVDTRTGLLNLGNSCTGGTSSSTALNLFLGKANVSGSVVATAMKVARAWIEVRSSDGTQFVTGTSADGNGEFKLSLEQGTYLLRAFSGGTVQKAPVQVKLVVGASSNTWTYCGSLSETSTGCAATGGTGAVALDLDAAAASASIERVSIASNLSGKHFVSVSKCTSVDANTCTGETLDTSFTVSTDESGDAQVALPAGSWKLKAVPLPSESLSGYESVLTVDGSGTTSITWPTS